MIVNFTENYQFHTRLQIKNQDIQIVDTINILGTFFRNKTPWDENFSILIRKVNARMLLLRKVWSFGLNIAEMVHLWKTFCLNILEQSCLVWGNMLTVTSQIWKEPRNPEKFCQSCVGRRLQKLQKCFNTLQLETFESRRTKQTLGFAKSSLADGHFHGIIKKKKKIHGPF